MKYIEIKSNGSSIESGGTNGSSIPISLPLLLALDFAIKEYIQIYTTYIEVNLGPFEGPLGAWAARRRPDCECWYC